MIFTLYNLYYMDQIGDLGRRVDEKEGVSNTINFTFIDFD
jgi:hypothetical protein